MTGATRRRELTIIVTDLYLPPEVREGLAGSADRPAALPALEQVLARASARESGDWRALAASLAGVGLGDAIPVAAVSVAAGAREIDRATHSTAQWWVLTPVCLQAAHDHVKLAQIVALRTDEWERIAAGIGQEFGADLGPVHPVASAEAYVSAREPLDATTTDPARVVGRDVAESLPKGAQGNVLRRLTTELQMWLHSHPVNTDRERHGLRPANAFWFWGGGTLPLELRNARVDTSSGLDLPALHSEDRFLRGLWSLRGRDVAATPRSTEARFALLSQRSDAVVSVSLAELPGESWQERLAAFDCEWLAPVVAALKRGALERLVLQVNDGLWTLRARDLWRVWRRPRPWLEAIA